MSGRVDAWLRLPATHAHHSALRDRARDRMVYSILAGTQVHILGQPATVTINWRDGLPCGFTEESLRQFGLDGLAMLDATRDRYEDSP